MNRRSFLSALAAVVFVKPCAPRWWGSFGDSARILHGPEAVLTPLQARAFIENRVVLDGAEMKRWLNQQIEEAIKRNPDELSELRRSLELKR